MGKLPLSFYLLSFPSILPPTPTLPVCLNIPYWHVFLPVSFHFLPAAVCALYPSLVPLPAPLRCQRLGSFTVTTAAPPLLPPPPHFFNTSLTRWKTLPPCILPALNTPNHKPGDHRNISFALFYHCFWDIICKLNLGRKSDRNKTWIVSWNNRKIKKLGVKTKLVSPFLSQLGKRATRGLAEFYESKSSSGFYLRRLRGGPSALEYDSQWTSELSGRHGPD